MSKLKLHKEFGLNPTMPICFYCGEDKGELILLGASYKGEAPSRMSLDTSPCDTCIGYMEQGIILLSVTDNTKEGDDNPYRTGRMSVIKEEAALKMFGESLGEARMAYVTDGMWDEFNLSGVKDADV